MDIASSGGTLNVASRVRPVGLLGVSGLVPPVGTVVSSLLGLSVDAMWGPGLTLLGSAGGHAGGGHDLAWAILSLLSQCMHGRVVEMMRGLGWRMRPRRARRRLLGPAECSFCICRWCEYEKRDSSDGTDTCVLGRDSIPDMNVDDVDGKMMKTRN
jgi:hypothetical protein